MNIPIGCSCKVAMQAGRLSIRYCRIHEQAPGLLSALRRAMEAGWEPDTDAMVALARVEDKVVRFDAAGKPYLAPNHLGSDVEGLSTWDSDKDLYHDAVPPELLADA